MSNYNKMKTEMLLNFYADEICLFLNVPKKDIFLKRKYRGLTDIRAMICYLTKKQFPEAVLRNIAAYFKQTHATVIHSIKKIEDLKKSDEKIKRTIEHCEKLNFVEAILEGNGFEKMGDNYFAKRPEGILMRKDEKTYFSIDGYAFHRIQDADIFDTIIISKNIGSNPFGVLINSLKS